MAVRSSMWTRFHGDKNSSLHHYKSIRMRDRDVSLVYSTASIQVTSAPTPERRCIYYYISQLIRLLDHEYNLVDAPKVTVVRAHRFAINQEYSYLTCSHKAKPCRNSLTRSTIFEFGSRLKVLVHLGGVDPHPPNCCSHFIGPPTRITN